MSDFGANYSLRDEIRDFWSERAATFDQSVGHEIFSEAERRGWHRLIRKHLGEGGGRPALDLASGTGVISHLMHDMGFKVTGADWSEAMINQAKAKAAKRNSGIRFIMRDAENTMEPRDSYEVAITRHLVWTLVDPKAAFAEWFAVLKPGGKLLIVDGNMGQKTWVGRWAATWQRLTGAADSRPHMDPKLAERHRSIHSRVHFANGMQAGDVVALLREAGFVDPVVDRQLFDIHLAQARKMPLLRGLDRLVQDRFAICVRKPG